MVSLLKDFGNFVVVFYDESSIVKFMKQRQMFEICMILIPLHKYPSTVPERQYLNSIPSNHQILSLTDAGNNTRNFSNTILVE